MPTIIDHTQTGYIQDFRLVLDAPRTNPDYYELHLTDDSAGTKNSERWFLLRDVSASVDSPGGTRMAVSFSNVSQAIIASAKDAMFAQKRVKLEGADLSMLGGPLTTGHVIRAITVYK